MTTNAIEVTINATEVELVCNFTAAKELGKKYHGLLPVIDALNLGSLEAATDIVFHALGKKDSEREALREHVYLAGLDYLAPRLVRYVIGLMRGGRIPAEAAEGAVNG